MAYIKQGSITTNNRHDKKYFLLTQTQSTVFVTKLPKSPGAAGPSPTNLHFILLTSCCRLYVG